MTGVSVSHTDSDFSKHFGGSPRPEPAFSVHLFVSGLESNLPRVKAHEIIEICPLTRTPRASQPGGFRPPSCQSGLVSSVQQPTSPNAANHSPIRRASESGPPAYRRERMGARAWCVLLYGYAPWCDTQKMGLQPGQGQSKLRVRFVDDIKYDGGSPFLGESWRTPFYLLQTRTLLISVHKGSPTQSFLN